MNRHETPRFPRGFRCASRNCGLKKSDPDLALFVSEVPAEAAAIFTRNHFPGAPVIVGRELVRGGRLQAVVVNAKVSNVATGERGIEDARMMGRLAAAEVGVAPELVLMSSTGVIGRRLPMEKIEAGIQGISAELCDDPWVGARGIMTTDTEPKVLSVEVGGATITAVGKGAGMISPNMATMLVFIFTDAAVPAPALRRHLLAAADRSFHCLSVDTDTSTSDTVAILANGLAGPVDEGEFGEALATLCRGMAEWVARDGEGATKLLRVHVEGAADDREGMRIAKAVVDSPLIKTMAFGADPNVGRILMAIGKCVDCRIDPSRTSAEIQGMQVIQGGVRADFEESEVRERLQQGPVDIRISLGIGEGRGLGLGCDLTEGYVEENAAYASS